MAKIDRFEDLEIWKIAVAIAVQVYILCDSEPLKSDWGMKDQIRRHVPCRTISQKDLSTITTLILLDFLIMLKGRPGSLGIN